MANVTSKPDTSTPSSHVGIDYPHLAVLAMLAIVFLVLGHLKMPNDGGHALFLPFNTISWSAIYVVVALGLWRMAATRMLICSGLTKRLSIACCLLSIPLLYLNADLGESAYRMIGLWSGLLLFVSLQQFNFQKQSLFTILLLVLAAAWIEAGRYWWIMFSSYSEHGVFSLSSNVELFGVFQQRNVLASFIGTGIVCSGYLLAYHKRLGGGIFLTSLLLVSPLFLSQLLHAMSSRAGWYGTALGVTFLLPIIYQKAGPRLLGIWVAAIFSGLGLSLIMSSVGGWEAPTKEIVSLSGQRQAMYSQAILLLLENWLGGVGYGRFEVSYIQFVADKFGSGEITSVSIPDTFHPHNEFLLWGVEGGVVPLVGLVLASWAVWVRVLNNERTYSLGLIGLFLPITFHSQVEYPFYQSVLHWVVFILVILLVDISQNDKKKLALLNGPVFGLRIAGVALPVVASWFLLTTLYSGVLLTQFNSGQASMAILQEINNPIVWRDKIDYAVTSTLLVDGVRTGNVENMQPYMQWGPNIITREPRPLFYEYLILAYQQSGQQEKANQTLAEFEYLFPGREFTEISIR